MTVSLKQQFIPQPFYCPKIPHPEARHFRKLIPLVKYIAEKHVKIVGCSYVQNVKKRTWTPVVITQEPYKGICILNPHADWRYFTVYQLKNGLPLSIGYASASYRNERDEPETVYLAEITNEKRADFKYTGYLLIKAVQQIFEKKCKGKMYLNAASSEPFYEKLGFEHTHKPYMALPPKSMENWLDEIHRNPLSIPAEPCCHIL